LLPYVDSLVRALVVTGNSSLSNDKWMRAGCMAGVAVIDVKAPGEIGKQLKDGIRC